MKAFINVDIVNDGENVTGFVMTDEEIREAVKDEEDIHEYLCQSNFSSVLEIGMTVENVKALRAFADEIEKKIETRTDT